MGVKRTCRYALQMSAFDPKRTFVNPSMQAILPVTMSPLERHHDVKR